MQMSLLIRNFYLNLVEVLMNNVLIIGIKKYLIKSSFNKLVTTKFSGSSGTTLNNN